MELVANIVGFVDVAVIAAIQTRQTNETRCTKSPPHAAKCGWQDLTLILLMSCDLAVPPGALAHVDALVWISLLSERQGSQYSDDG